MMKVLNRLDSVGDRGPVLRFAFGAACGLVMVLGGWIISTLSHAQDANLGFSWQFAVTLVLFFGILSLGVRRKK
jgi:hypothetical protein